MKWFNEVSVATLKAVTACFVALATGAMYSIFTWNKITVDEVSWGMWLSFVCGLWGVSYATFKKKRETFIPPSSSPELDKPSTELEHFDAGA